MPDTRPADVEKRNALEEAEREEVRQAAEDVLRPYRNALATQDGGEYTSIESDTGVSGGDGE